MAKKHLHTPQPYEQRDIFYFFKAVLMFPITVIKWSIILTLEPFLSFWYEMIDSEKPRRK